MASKSKFQISRLLEERIKHIANNVDEYEPDFSSMTEAYIIGFHSSNVSNYIGLLDHDIPPYVSQQILGLVFFISSPSEEDIVERLTEVKGFNKDLGSFKADKNNHLFLIYSFDIDSKLVIKRIFDSDEKQFLSEQPKLVVLEAEKLYNHSSLIEVILPLKLNIFDNGSQNRLANKSKLDECLSKLKNSLTSESKKLKLHIVDSNYSISSFVGQDKNLLTETLYDHLNPPQDVYQMGDYLPQLTKDDKKKLVDKWRNKIKAQHLPLKFQIEHEDFSYPVGDDDAVDAESNQSEQMTNYYKLKLDTMMFIHLNDPISKSLHLILYNLRQLIVQTFHSILYKKHGHKSGAVLENNEIKFCNFQPSSLGHLVQAVYTIPKETESIDYNYLKELRLQLHNCYLSPKDRPQFRYSQRLIGLSMKNPDELAGLLCNVHKDLLDKSGIKGGTRNVIEGTYTYHHYMQNRFNDNGWGCAYRSLQTIISWFKHQGYIYSPDVDCTAGKKKAGEDKCESLRKLLAKESRVPSHEEIQKILVDVGDKQPNFIGSQKWIGSQEVCYVLNHLYNLDSKFISVSSGSELASKARDLGQHFAIQSTPVMIGGGVLAHTIIGTDFNEKNGDISYLILDPHYTGTEDLTSIQKKGWCGWKKNNFWDKNSFYNLCLPQRPVEF